MIRSVGLVYLFFAQCAVAAPTPCPEIFGTVASQGCDTVIEGVTICNWRGALQMVEGTESPFVVEYMAGDDVAVRVNTMGQGIAHGVDVELAGSFLQDRAATISAVPTAAAHHVDVIDSADCVLADVSYRGVNSDVMDVIEGPVQKREMLMILEQSAVLVTVTVTEGSAMGLDQAVDLLGHFFFGDPE